MKREGIPRFQSWEDVKDSLPEGAVSELVKFATPHINEAPDIVVHWIPGIRATETLVTMGSV